MWYCRARGLVVVKGGVTGMRQGRMCRGSGGEYGDMTVRGWGGGRSHLLLALVI